MAIHMRPHSHSVDSCLAMSSSRISQDRCRVRQVPRILNPVVLVLDALPGLCADVKLAAYIKSVWGGVEECRCGRQPTLRCRAFVKRPERDVCKNTGFADVPHVSHFATGHMACGRCSS